MSNWVLTPLSECLSKVIDYRGRTPKKLGLNWSSSGYKALSANNIKFSGLDKLDSVNYADEELYNKWMKEEVRRGDLLLTSEAPSGQVMLWDSDEKIVLSQRLYALRVNDKIDAAFLKFYLQSPSGQKEIYRNNSGSTVAGISAKTFSNILISHPKDVVEQKRIAHVLHSIDKKINCNNLINSKLEDMAKTLYEYWFVQFNFPDTNGKPYKSSGGAMIYSDILKREIPKGWQVDSLANWIANDKTGDWGKEAPEGNHLLRVSCIRGADLNGLNGNGVVCAPTRYILSKNNSKLLSPFDFVIEISGGSPTQSTGRMANITPETLSRFSNPIICSNFCKAISLHDKSYFFNFSYQWKSAYDNGILFGWEGKTSGIKNLLFDAFTQKYFVPTPPQSLANKFFNFLAPIESKKQLLCQENDSLEATRDWLLPMLMNGQVTLS